jgi:hypothetical protein
MSDRCGRMCQRCFRDCIPGSCYCELHKDCQRIEERERHDRNPATKLYNCKMWKVAKRYVLARDIFCTFDGGCPRLSTDVHHEIDAMEYVALHDGDTTFFYDQSNLRGLCHEHHSLITGRRRRP